METRTCKTCSVEKPIQKFKKTGEYRQRECRACMDQKIPAAQKKQEYARYYEANKDRVLAKQRQNRLDNLERERARDKQRSITRKDSNREYKKRYSKLNGDRLREKKRLDYIKKREHELAEKAKLPPPPPITERQCKYCQAVKPITSFKRQRRVSGVGWSWECYQCRYKRTPESDKQKANDWQKANRANRRIYHRKWSKENPQSAKVQKSKRRARERGAEGQHSSKDIKRLYVEQDGLCGRTIGGSLLGCQSELNGCYHLDHILPLARGGTNWLYNLQLLCPQCNLRKGAKHPEEWAEIAAKLTCQLT